MSESSPARLSILAVTHYPPLPGGSARSSALLWQGIARRGHRVHALSPITAETRDYDAQRAGIPQTLTVSRYDVPYFNLVPYDIEAYERFQEIEHEGIRSRLPELIDRYRPDVVVSAHETLGGAVVDTAHSKGLPCALMLRGSPTWQIVTGAYPEERTRAYLDLYRRADVVIAVGNYMKTGLAEMGVGNVAHIPNMLDLEMFSPGPRDPALAARYGIDEAAVVVLHASVMSPRKRSEDVLQSAALTLPQAPKMIYLFVGGEERAKHLEEMNRRLGLTERVRFIAGVPYEQMPEHIRLADMVALASQGEGLARIYVEAQACGRVLISSDIPAGREVVEHGHTGLLFKTGAVDDLAAQVLRAYSDPKLREDIGRAARQRVAAHEIGRVIDLYIRTFSELTHPATAFIQ